MSPFDGSTEPFWKCTRIGPSLILLSGVTSEILHLDMIAGGVESAPDHDFSRNQTESNNFGTQHVRKVRMMTTVQIDRRHYDSQ